MLKSQVFEVVETPVFYTVRFYPDKIVAKKLRDEDHVKSEGSHWVSFNKPGFYGFAGTSWEDLAVVDLTRDKTKPLEFK